MSSNNPTNNPTGSEKATAGGAPIQPGNNPPLISTGLQQKFRQEKTETNEKFLGSGKQVQFDLTPKPAPTQGQNTGSIKKAAANIQPG